MDNRINELKHALQANIRRYGALLGTSLSLPDKRYLERRLEADLATLKSLDGAEARGRHPEALHHLPIY